MGGGGARSFALSVCVSWRAWTRCVLPVFLGCLGPLVVSPSCILCIAFGCLLCASQETFREVSDSSVSRCFDVHAPFSLLTSCPRHVLRSPRDRKVCRDMVDLKELATKKMQEERKKQKKEKKASKVCQRRRQTVLTQCRSMILVTICALPARIAPTYAWPVRADFPLVTFAKSVQRSHRGAPFRVAAAAPPPTRVIASEALPAKWGREAPKPLGMVLRVWRFHG